MTGLGGAGLGKVWGRGFFLHLAAHRLHAEGATLLFCPFPLHAASEAVPGALYCPRLRGSLHLGERQVTPAFDLAV